MVFGFDPRKLVEEDKKEKKKEVEDVVWEQVSIDEEEEKKENQLRRTSNIKNALSTVDQIIREFKYEKKYGKDAYHDAKLKQNPYYRDTRKYTDEENKGFVKVSGLAGYLISRLSNSSFLSLARTSLNETLPAPTISLILICFLERALFPDLNSTNTISSSSK